MQAGKTLPFATARNRNRSWEPHLVLVSGAPTIHAGRTDKLLAVSFVHHRWTLLLNDAKIGEQSSERNTFSGLKTGAFRPPEGDVPALKQIACSVDISIMRDATATTHPFSYSERCDTSGASGTSASGAALGSPSFVGLDVGCPMPHGFVREHPPQRRPSRVIDRLPEPGLRQRGGVYIAATIRSYLAAIAAEARCSRSFLTLAILA